LEGCIGSEVQITRPEPATLQVAELVEHEQRMVARTSEVAVVGRTLLLAMGRTLGAVHVENDAVGRLSCMHTVDPDAGQVAERGEIRLARQPLGLEPAHLAGRGRRPVHALAADDGAHHRIAGEPLGIVDVFVAGEPAVDRLAQQARQMVADVPATPPLAKHRGRQRGQAEDVVQLAVCEQTAIGRDPGTVELELDAAVEGDPKRLARFTRRVRHPRLAPPVLSLSHTYRNRLVVSANWQPIQEIPRPRERLDQRAVG
jgi:hypothetical protein